MFIRHQAEVIELKNGWKSIFDCDDEGEMKSYVGCKVDIDRENHTLKMTQLVIVQSFQDDFDLPGKTPKVPLPVRTMYSKGNEEDLIDKKAQKQYRKAVGKLLHVSKWTQPTELNAVRELSHFEDGSTQEQNDGAHNLMKHIVATPN